MGLAHSIGRDASLSTHFQYVLLAIAGWMSRHQQEVIAYLVEENRVLREQIGNPRLKFNDDQRRRLAVKAKKLGRKTLGQVATIAAPETLLTWHRNLIGRNRTGSARRTPGRPPTRQEIAALAVRMAEENRSWGYRRIQGALANLGHDLAHNTIRNILKRHGIEPSPERARKTTVERVPPTTLGADRRQRLLQHKSAERIPFRPRWSLLGFMKLSTRRVDSARTSGERNGRPMIPIVRKMTDDMEGLS